MEYIIFAVVMAAIILLFLLKGMYDYKKARKKFIQGLYRGALPQREYKPGEFARIARCFQKHQEGFFLDDITWNDLDMDEVFIRMNYTYSAAGEEYLYDMLRRPCFAEKELLARERTIEYFMGHPDERVAYQFIFSELGHTGKFSIYDYLDHLDDLGKRSNLADHLMICLFLLSALFMFVNLPLGLVAMMGILVYNNVSYFKVKEEIEPYVISFAYVFRILDAVNKLSSHKIDILKEEFAALDADRAAMGRFRRGAFLVMSGGRVTGAGSPLDMILDFFRMGFHLDLMKFNQMLSQVRGHIGQIDEMITILGKTEAMIAIGLYRDSLESWCVPLVLPPESSGAKIKASGLYHPLIADPVKNDFCTDRSVLITGSNASGKSTFLRTMALNAIFAQTIHTCLAESYAGNLSWVVTSMSIKDDVQGGDSYYMAEVKSLKRILDMGVWGKARESAQSGTQADTEGDAKGSAQGDIRECTRKPPILCFVDEVLRGTNTVERIAASTQILKSLSRKNCLCFAATHDIELTHLLEGPYVNYHFSEEIAEDDIFFSYKIMEGRATTRNAIKLLGIMGYEPGILREAEDMAADFLASGVWRRLDGETAQ